MENFLFFMVVNLHDNSILGYCKLLKTAFQSVKGFLTPKKLSCPCKLQKCEFIRKKKQWHITWYAQAYYIIVQSIGA